MGKSKYRYRKRSKSKIVIAVIAVMLIVALIGYIVSLFVLPKKIIEFSSVAQIKISLNKNNKVIKTVALNSDGQTVLDNMDSSDKDIKVVLKDIIETSNELNILDDDTSIDILAVVDDMEKNKVFVQDLSKELQVLYTEIPISSKINQYKVTKKDYKKINKIKKNTTYDCVKIIQDGFVSSEKEPYVTGVVYKDASFSVIFSKEVIFNGKEEVICTDDSTTYKVTPAGYNQHSLAVFVEEYPYNTALNFDVSIKDSANLYGVTITPKETDPEDLLGITFTIDSEINKEKLKELKDQISLLDESDQEELMSQYDVLESYVDRISTNSDLDDFNIMVENLQKSIDKVSNNESNDENLPTESPSEKPTTEPEPTTTPEPTATPTTTNLTELNNKYYNELNGYKAVVLNIQNQTEKNTLNKEINNLYYELSIAKTPEDYTAFESDLNVFLGNLQPYR